MRRKDVPVCDTLSKLLEGLHEDYCSSTLFLREKDIQRCKQIMQEKEKLEACRQNKKFK
jgi:hypothetical protein